MGYFRHNVCRKVSAAAVVVAVSISCATAPAHAAGFAAKESWTRGAAGIDTFVNSATCDFMQSHSHLMRIKAGESYEVNKEYLFKDEFVRNYMSKRVDQGAGRHAAMIPGDVREKLIDFGIAATLKRAADCSIIPNAQEQADAVFAQIKDEGNAKYATLDPVGVVMEIPTLLTSMSS